ncbi:MAG TPA: glycosyltransferase family 2 protein [Thermomicrobiales bacterium]|jgi:glycosyltransferase involved in cell wall biosynthesis
MQPRIFAVIPALNEEAAIGQVVRNLPRDLLAQVIVVDNGSTDDTATAAWEAGAVVTSEPERGYGAACAAGVALARRLGAEIIVLLDGDASDVPTDLPAILAPVLAGEADLAMGSRARGAVERGALTVQQRWGNWLAARILRRYGLEITDLGPFRAIRTDALAALHMQERTYGWSTEMLVKAARAGLRVREVPVSYRKRAAGQSKVGGTVRGSIEAAVVILSTAYRYAGWSPNPPAPFPTREGGATAVGTH